jgi:hypothetical protein
VTKPEADDAAREYAATLLAEARDELQRADQKASILLAAAGVAIGTVLAGILSAGWSPSLLRSPWDVLWEAGAVATLGGIGALIWAIYPRTTHGRNDDSRLFYFGQAGNTESVADLERELRKSSGSHFERSADQLWRVSRVVNTKYRAVRWGVRLLVLGGALILGGSVGSSFGP